ncbi:MAG: hypothetical protein QM725_11075 [Lacibacter sp.]
MRNVFSVLFCILSLVGFSQSTFVYPSLYVEYDSAVTYKHLKLIPVKRTDSSEMIVQQNDQVFYPLKTALKKGWVKIKERGNYMVDNINVLIIENNSNEKIFIRSGEMVTGGRQDRVIAADTILMPGKKEYTIPVYCIEESRWSEHEKKFSYGGNAASGLQKIIDSAHNQKKLWEEIRRLLVLNNQTSSSSYATLLSNHKIADSTNEYVKFFLKQFSKRDSSIVGIIASSGNKVLGADVFINEGLFYQTLPELLNKYCIEAVINGSPASISLNKEQDYANEMLNRETQDKFLKNKGKRILYKGKLIQITGY